MAELLPAKEEVWNFPCDQCGACCKAIGCPDLNEDNTCSIYAKRPYLCNTKKMFYGVHSKTMTKQEYFAQAEVACNILKDKFSPKVTLNLATQLLNKYAKS